jgi:hypothetical protein
LGWGYVDDGRLVEIDTSNPRVALEKFEALKEAGIEVHTTLPYDPFVNYRQFIIKAHERGICRCDVPEYLTAHHPEGYYLGVVIVTLADGRVILGEGRAQPFYFPAMTPTELCSDLAVLDAGERLRKYIKGEHKSSAPEEADHWRRRMAEWSKRLH